MTAPVWIASPPEVHSALLSAGPGAGPLSASAAAWAELSSEYFQVADELTAVLTAVQSGGWHGPSADAYLAANAPYLGWLLRAGTDGAVMAVQQQVAATGYTSALAAMPTLGELAANHAAHAVLVATNFFGVNTIPIAANEADYVRMWIQAATVMTTYHAVATTAVAAAPANTPAPQIVAANPAAGSLGSLPPDRTNQIQEWLDHIGFTAFYNRYLQPFIDVLMNNPFLQSLFSGFDPYLPWTGNPFAFLSPFNIAFALGYPMDIGSYVAYLSQTFAFIGADLAAAFASGNPATISFTLLFTTIEAVGTIITDTIALLKTLLEQAILIPILLPLLSLPLAPLAVTPSVLGGLSGLALLHSVPITVVPPAVLPPVALALAPTPAPAVVPAGALAAPPPAATVPAPSPPPPPAAPPLAPVDGFSYLVGGMDLQARHAAGSSVQRRKTMEPAGTAAPAAAAAAEEQGRLARRRRAKSQMLGRGYEYMDLEPDHVSQPAESGAGPLGFAGTVPGRDAAQPTGLATLPGDSLGPERAVPMVPGSWVDRHD